MAQRLPGFLAELENEAHLRPEQSAHFCQVVAQYLMRRPAWTLQLCGACQHFLQIQAEQLLKLSQRLILVNSMQS
jgi:hypothetical protein